MKMKNTPLFNEQFIRQLENRPHLFILGAGATVAAIGGYDKKGKACPVMEDFIKKIGAYYIIEGVKLKTKSKNLEDIYSELNERTDCLDVCKQLELYIVEYMKSLMIHDTPTVYDYLIFSLTSNDCIATFNWDPFLLQAYNRVNKITHDLPELLFLHGNVGVGLCENCKRYTQLQNTYCPKCHARLSMPPLLYPIRHKDYESNIFIRHEWNVFEEYIQKAGMVTIFGYGLPYTDIAIKQILLRNYNNGTRILDTLEIIDVKPYEELLQLWSDFLPEVRGRIKIYKSFFESFAAKYPRQNVKGYVTQYIKSRWIDNYGCIMNNMSFVDLEELLYSIENYGTL